MPYSKDPIIATVAEALNQQTVDYLRRLLPHLPTTERPTRKAELVALIQPYLQGKELKAQWEKLDPLQQTAVSEVVYSLDSHFDAAQFQAKYGQLPNWGAVNAYGTLQNPSRLGLFFFDYLMPEELKERLSAFVPPPAQAKLKTENEIPKTIQQEQPVIDYNSRTFKTQVVDVSVEPRLMERAAQQDLLAVLRLIDTGKVSVSDKTRFPSTATLKTMTAILSGGDYYTDPPPEEGNFYDQPIGLIRAFAWSMLVQAGGLAELSGKKLRLTKAGQKALTLPPPKTLHTLWQKWRKTKLLDEFRRIDQIKGQTGKGKRSLTAVVGRREAITMALYACPVNHWIQVDEFFRYIQASDYDFEVTRNPWDLYICEAGYGSLGYLGYHDWSMLQGRYVLCLLFEYAATLGMVDVAYISPREARSDYCNNWGTDDLEFLSRYDGLLYFRLTPLGAYCLELTDHYIPASPEAQPVLRVLPNLEIAAMGESLTAADVLLLELYTQKVSDAVWRLDQTKLLKAVAEGYRLQELEDFLVARSPEPLPQTVEQFLADVKSRTGSLQDLGTARLIECNDPALAVLIANDSRTKKYCFLAGERRLVVPLESETRFHRALQKLGYSLPKP